MFKGLIVNVTAEYLTGRNMFPCKNKQPNYASETFFNRDMLYQLESDELGIFIRELFSFCIAQS